MWFLAIGGFGLWSISANAICVDGQSTLGVQFCGTATLCCISHYGCRNFDHDRWRSTLCRYGTFWSTPHSLGMVYCCIPCLLLNYAGQGALLLRNPEALANPFYMLIPEWALYPMIGLATAAAVIASQAVITGVFSMVNQAIQLRYLPRLTVKHTSEVERGQIYLPFINWALFISVLILILLFENSANLASAYGVAVTMTMLCGTILISVLAYGLWRWPVWKVAIFAVPFLLIDLIFVASTSLKIASGRLGSNPDWCGTVYDFNDVERWSCIGAQSLGKDALPIDLFIQQC